MSTIVGNRAQASEQLPAWQQGNLDLHHINTGRGNAMFAIFPDGTTLLFDAGDLDAEEFSRRAAPLKLVPQRPSGQVTPGAAIANYIRRNLPPGESGIDYAVISHFHGDHYGTMRDGLAQSAQGNFRRTGIAEVGDELPIRTLIDRNAPAYDSPVDLVEYHGASFANFLAFQAAMPEMEVESLIPGEDRQIVLRNDPEAWPEFEVRNVTANGVIWTGVGRESRALFDPAGLLDEEGRFTENPLSISLRIGYGRFEYFTGGDLTGLRAPGVPPYFDVETPVGDVLGEVDVLTLNHHGNRDATNERFLADLQPRVIIQQTWVSDHPGSEVVHRIISRHIYPGDRDIFATHILEETRIAIGPWLTQSYASMSGHVIVRVEPGGDRYRVFVLDDRRNDGSILSIHGPYESR